MKNTMIILSLLLLLFSTATEGFTADAKRHSWEMGVLLSDFSYEEPGVMREDGVFYGIKGAYVFRKQNTMLKAEVRYSQGEVDYKNSGTLDGIDDNLFEARALFGYRPESAQGGESRPSIMGYVGLGYRYLNDDSAGMLSSTGASGYKRESNYLYIPIGIEIEAALTNGWVWGLMLEYDYFLKGRQVSHFSALGYDNNLENDQNDGYGIRSSVRFTTRRDRIGYTIEPFVNYWNVENSDLAPLFVGGSLDGYGFEPANNSTELGIAFTISF